MYLAYKLNKSIAIYIHIIILIILSVLAFAIFAYRKTNLLQVASNTAAEVSHRRVRHVSTCVH